MLNPYNSDQTPSSLMTLKNRIVLFNSPKQPPKQKDVVCLSLQKTSTSRLDTGVAISQAIPIRVKMAFDAIALANIRTS